MKCPHCKETNLLLTERKGIEIDYCPDCRGIWLDRGELDKMLEKVQAESSHQERPAREQYPSQSDSYHKPYKRKKSFLEELFD